MASLLQKPSDTSRISHHLSSISYCSHFQSRYLMFITSRTFDVASVYKKTMCLRFSMFFDGFGKLWVGSTAVRSFTALPSWPHL